MLTRERQTAKGLAGHDATVADVRYRQPRPVRSAYCEELSPG
jgi:hypothetical protein